MEYSDRIKSYQQAEFSAWDNFWLPFKLVAPIVMIFGGIAFAIYSLL